MVWTDRQTEISKEADGWTTDRDKRSDGQTDKDKWTERQTEISGWMDRQTDREKSEWMYGPT